MNEDTPDVLKEKYAAYINDRVPEVTADQEDINFVFGEVNDYFDSIKGGSTSFINKIIKSFDDPGDSKRPQFPSDFAAGGIILAADSGDFGSLLASTKKIANIFKLEFTASYNPPTNVNAIAGNRTIRLTYSPNDGQVCPLLASESFTNEAIKLGAQFNYKEKVIGLIKQRKNNILKVIGVKTTKDEYHADAVVNAAGADATEICKMAGLDIPVNPDSHV